MEKIQNASMRGARHGALAGKTIVLTQAAEHAGMSLQATKGAGARVLVLPMIEFQPLADPAPLDLILSQLREFQWVVFTSQAAVRFFCSRLRELGRAVLDLPTPPKVAVIGASTMGAASSEGLRIDFFAPGAHSGKEFAQELSRHVRGQKLLLPQSDQARRDVGDILRESGANVTSVVAYRTCMPKFVDRQLLGRIRRDGADVFVFASPSAFRNFADTVGQADLARFARDSAFAAIGPTTAESIREAGLPVEIVAAKPSSEAVIHAVVEYFSKSRRTKSAL